MRISADSHNDIHPPTCSCCLSCYWVNSFMLLAKGNPSICGREDPFPPTQSHCLSNSSFSLQYQKSPFLDFFAINEQTCFFSFLKISLYPALRYSYHPIFSLLVSKPPWKSCLFLLSSISFPFSLQSPTGFNTHHTTPSNCLSLHC